MRTKASGALQRSSASARTRLLYAPFPQHSLELANPLLPMAAGNSAARIFRVRAENSAVVTTKEGGYKLLSGARQVDDSRRAAHKLNLFVIQK